MRDRVIGALNSWQARDVLVPFGVTRLLLVLVGWFAQYVMPPTAYGDTWRASSHVLINDWAGWDSHWYIDIAQHGYSLFPTPDGQVSVAFSPGLPLAIKLSSLLARRDDPESLAVIGIVVTNIALLAAVFYLVRLARDDFDAGTASRAGLYLLVFPATLFLSAVYPHALFLAFAISSFFYARRGAWWRAGLLGGAAALTRSVGILLLLPILWELVARRSVIVSSRHRIMTSLGHGVVAPALIALGLVAWIGYLGVQFGRPLAFVEAERGWNKTPTAPWQILEPYFNGHSSVYGSGSTYLDLAFIVLYTVLVIATWRYLPRSYALFATLVYLVPLSSGSSDSIMRYGLDMFPIFIVLALAGRQRWFHESYLILSTGLATVFAVMFALHYWVA
jgi:hypothetical protein